MRWVIGFVLIVVGTAFLGNALSWWQPADFEMIWKFWPVLLILLGVSIMSRHWRWGNYLVLLVLILSLAFVFCSIIFNKPVSIKNNGNSELTTSTISEDKLENTKKAAITVDSGALELNIKGGSTKLVDGVLKSNAFNVSTSRQDSGDMANVDIKTEKIDEGLFWQKGSLTNTMDLNLSDSVPTMLTVNAGASKLDLDLSSIILSGLSVKSGASDLNVTVGDKTEQKSSLSIDAGASDITLRIPKNIGAEIALSAAFSDRHINDFDEINSKLYRSKDFDKSEKQISINISSSISSITVDRY